MHRLVYNYPLYVDNSYKNLASSPLSSRLVQSAAHVSSTPRVLKCTQSLTNANRSHSSQLRAVVLLFLPEKDETNQAMWCAFPHHSSVVPLQLPTEAIGVYGCTSKPSPHLLHLKVHTSGDWGIQTFLFMPTFTVKKDTKNKSM